MDVPISIGVIVTVAMSLYETATGGEHAYFDGAVMLLFFLLAGRFLDSVMRARAEDSVAALLRRVPSEATVLIDGKLVRRRVDMLLPGDVLFVAAGERIAADGIVIEGSSNIDRAHITGESLPERIASGGRVLAGTINLSRPLTVRATAVGNQTAIADIARLMEQASGSKSLYVRIADRAARLYAPAVHSLAAHDFARLDAGGRGRPSIAADRGCGLDHHLPMRARPCRSDCAGGHRGRADEAGHFGERRLGAGAAGDCRHRSARQDRNRDARSPRCFGPAGEGRRARYPCSACSRQPPSARPFRDLHPGGCRGGEGRSDR